MRTATLALLMMACSGPPEGAPRPGGGTEGAFDGQLTVFVVDPAGAPLAGIGVGVDGEALGETDEDGRFAVSLERYDVVSVGAEGHRSEWWVGADAAVLTIPLTPLPPPALPTARVRATIAGWDALTPTDGHELHAVLGRARDKALDAPANSIEGGDDRLDCVAPRDAVCELEITVPAGTTTLFAQLVEVDPTDGSVTPVGFALGDAIALEPEEVRDGVSLPLLPESALMTVEVARPASTDPRLDAVVGVPGLGLEASVLVLAPIGDATTFLLPSLAEVPAGASTWAIATASGPDASSRIATRAAAGDPLQPVASNAFLDPPILEANRVLRPEGAGLLEIRVGADLRILVFDDRPSVDAGLPAAGEITAIATEVSPGPDGWSLPAIERAWTRRSTVRIRR